MMTLNKFFDTVVESESDDIIAYSWTDQEKLGTYDGRNSIDESYNEWLVVAHKLEVVEEHGIYSVILVPPTTKYVGVRTFGGTTKCFIRFESKEQVREYIKFHGIPMDRISVEKSLIKFNY